MLFLPELGAHFSHDPNVFRTARWFNDFRLFILGVNCALRHDIYPQLCPSLLKHTPVMNLHDFCRAGLKREFK